MKFRWPLNDNHFTWLDRLKICAFFLNPKNRWTQDKYVKAYEEAWRDYTGVKYAVMTSSGSTANTLLAQYKRDNNKENRNIVVFPATTWQTSISPWIREGFTPKFIDINLEDFSICIWKLEKYLKRNHKKVNTIFITSLLGFTPNVGKLLKLGEKYGISIQFDNCENSFGRYKNKHICNIENSTSTTSLYFGHQTTTGSEGGMILTNNRDEYLYYLMARNHGMTRSLPLSRTVDECKKIINTNVDDKFDFYCLGNNFRSSDINAYMGLLDFKRINQYRLKREYLYSLFHFKLIDCKKYRSMTGLLGFFPYVEHVPFCIPIIVDGHNKKLFGKLKQLLEKEHIEYRPIISGFLGYQTCYKKYFKNTKEDYTCSKYIHDYGLYIGLHSGINEKQIENLAKKLIEL